MKARFFAIAALVLGLASCQKDFAPEMNSGDEVKVTLSVSAPELIGATRAGVDGEIDGQGALDSRFGAIDYLDGNVANDSRWDWNDVDIRYTMEVYDQEDLTTPIKDRQEIIKDQYQQVEFEVRLIPNRKYQFVVFADFVDQATKEPLRHVLGETLNDIALVNEALNDEVADCYFKSWEFEPTNNTSNQTEATLTRPYAKVRVIATDLAELNLNVHPEKIAIEYNTVIPTTFNAVKGTIDGDNTTKTFTYDYIAEIRNNMANHVYNADYDAMVDAKGRASHMTLFTDYILAEDEQSPINFKMTVSDKIKEIKVVDFNTEIPVQRNYLTTIIGDVLTTNVNVEVNISDDFAGEINKDMVFVGSVEELQAAINNFVNGQHILFANDIKGSVLVNQLDGKDYIIDGNGYKLEGNIEINGNGRQAGLDSVTIKNINFTTSEATINFIDANENEKYGNKYNYAHNVYVENCSFEGAGENVVGLKIRQAKNVVVKNCVANVGHSLAQLYGCNGVTVDGATVNAGRGISLGTSQACLVKDSQFDVDSYGLRGDADPATSGSLQIVKSTIKAAKPVIVRKFVDKKGNVLHYGVVNIDDATVLETSEEFQVVFTNGDDEEAYVIPVGTFTINDNNKFKVYPRNISEGVVYDGETFAVESAEGLNWFAAYVNGGYNFAGKTVALEADVDLQGQAWAGAGIKENKFYGSFDGNGYVVSNLTMEGGNNIAMFPYVGENVTIKNLTLENVNIKGDSNAAALVNSAANGLNVENVTVSGNIESPDYAAGLVMMASNFTITNCVNNANVTSGRAAGFVAWITAGAMIDGAVNNGAITGSYSACGIANRIAGTVKNSVNYGTIKGEGTESSAGIAGTATAATTFEYCYNYGDVTTTKDNANSSAAGILGQTPSKAATFNYCANFGAITAEQSYAAGIGYSLYGNVTANYCYNAGAVAGADGAGAIAPKAQYGANDTAKYCLNAGVITSANGKVFQGSNKNTSSYYYNNGELLNVADNAVVTVDAALAVLNGGADADFFVEENGVIVVK
ncbi:MAG: hypothetical protein J6Q28_01865 [Alistipes sp.]|nr:hypothetical protein [Alistipes sp.]